MEQGHQHLQRWTSHSSSSSSRQSERSPHFAALRCSLWTKKQKFKLLETKLRHCSATLRAQLQSSMTTVDRLTDRLNEAVQESALNNAARQQLLQNKAALEVQAMTARREADGLRHQLVSMRSLCLP